MYKSTEDSQVFGMSGWEMMVPFTELERGLGLDMAS